jgi:hypothetical protein
LANVLAGRSTATDAVPEIFPRRVVPASARTGAANRILLPTSTDPLDEIDEQIVALVHSDRSDDEMAVLDSHAITEHAAGSLRSRSTDAGIKEFLDARAVEIERRMHNFLESSCEWNSEDRPSLDDLVDPDDEVDDDAR